jgi:hypothetical protein
MNGTSRSHRTLLQRASALRALWLLPLLLVSCDKGDDAPPLPSTVVEAAPTALTDEVVDKTDIAVPEDFEEEAFTTIDEDNLEEQLDALEREIEGDTE